ncbi:unnamed protein product [Adineta ricciae]|uniref:Uncharacterized protein n=1 Tax=Adineta ricciae TaxID=249248 RepID=A0A814EDV7_ADIRI|nr:unnamed protein product [Adineta ricciae]
MNRHTRYNCFIRLYPIVQENNTDRQNLYKCTVKMPSLHKQRQNFTLDIDSDKWSNIKSSSSDSIHFIF